VFALLFWEYFPAGYFLARSGAQFNTVGKGLTAFRSRGGETVSEFYYQEVGRYGMAYSSFAYALAFASLAISLGVGGTLILKKG